MNNQNPWEELSDHENQINELDIEPDFYIDRPPTPIFIPNPEGDNKQIQVLDKTSELFDFDLEVEPILQVLVGKSLEHAQIEVIEEHEKNELRRHKIQFLQLKEAELMETQRMQEYKNRRTEESERRSLQQRTAKAQRVWTEKKLISRQKSKDFLNLFKRDTLKIMVDQGILRAPTTYSFDSHFVPQLHNQVLFDLKNTKEHAETTDAILN